MPRFQKPLRPRIAWGNPLAREVLFSVACGWDRGFRETNMQVTRSDRNKLLGLALGTPPAIGVTATEDFGWALCSGTDGWYEYDADNGVSVFIAGAGFSCAALVRPLVVPPLGTTNRRVFQKRNSGAAVDPGFDMFLDTFIMHTWSFEWSDGVTEQTLRSTTAPALNRSDLIVGTLSPQDNRARFYINGALENEAALAVVPANPVGQPIGVCGGIGPAGNAGGDNCVGMAALWNRELRPREVADLWADPYRMWR